MATKLRVLLQPRQKKITKCLPSSTLQNQITSDKGKLSDSSDAVANEGHDIRSLIGSPSGVDAITRKVLDAVDDEVTARCLLRLLNTGSSATLGDDTDAMEALTMIKAQVVAEHADYRRVVAEHRTKISKLEAILKNKVN